MKKINVAGGLLLFLIVIVSACSDMNDLHDIYLRNGEITYVGRIDSIKSFGGRDRALIQYWITDPRVKNLHLFWNQRRDSIVVQVPAHDPADSLEVIIGDGNGVIAEGDHTIFIYSYDDRGHRSIVFESLISVYGGRYQASLTNRPVSTTEVNEDNNLVINWAGILSADEIGILISYFDNNDNPIESFIANETLENPVVFDDIDVTKPISYRTMFTPGEFAIDTFYTEVAESIKVTLIENVALNKNTIVSDILNSNFPGSNAVDGIISSASRWVSTTTGEHWIEVDLGQPYPIRSFQTYNGTGDAPNMAIKNFLFQVNIHGEWVTIIDVSGNTNHSYSATFEEVITDKVRFFVPDYPDNQVRLFELEVYSIITLN
jgi:F5/8 type C domain.